MESLIGKTIDNYRILEVVGRGGMGVVLKALDTSLEKIVALKMIDPFLAKDENFVRRFKTEAKALAKLENPNIVTVHALRETESGFFMVMEYVESKTLSHYISEKGAFSISESISITKQILNAICHAHKVGVIHRDIKPNNVLLCYDGKIKVMDFGLAKVTQQQGPASTVAQTRAGTLYYMSPEQVKGLKNVDTRSDIYSIGMTIYEMVTGRVPFEKTDSDFTIQKHIVDGEIPSPSVYKPGIPKQFLKLILKSIEKDPAKRYQNISEMEEALAQIEKDISEKSEGTNKKISMNIIREKSPKKKNIILIASLFTIFLASMIVALYFLFIEATPSPPTITTVTIKNITITTATGGGDVTSGESSSVTERGVCWSTSQNPSTSDSKTVDGTGTGIFTSSITGLSASTTYYVRAYATNSAGTSYGNQVSFTTNRNDINPLASLTIKSIPPNAVVVFDHIPKGRTGNSGLRIDSLNIKKYSITLSLNGYDEISFDQEVYEGNNIITKELNPMPIPIPIEFANIDLKMDEDGFIAVDNGKKINVSANLTVTQKISTKNHLIRFENENGEKKDIQVVGGKQKELMCYFQHKVGIQTLDEDENFIWASIILDDKLTGKETAAEMTLSAGTHKIFVKREGYRTLEEPKIIKITPEFSRKTIQIVFHIKKL